MRAAKAARALPRAMRPTGLGRQSGAAAIPKVGATGAAVGAMLIQRPTRPPAMVGVSEPVKSSAAWAVPTFVSVPKDRIAGAIQRSAPRRVLGAETTGAAASVDTGFSVPGV